MVVKTAKAQKAMGGARCARHEEFNMSNAARATVENGIQEPQSLSVGQFHSGRLHPTDSEREDIWVVARVYLDESADEKRERFFAVGGFVGVDLYWDTLELLWIDRTRGLKEPFHSAECECGHGQFKGWPKPDRDQLIADLVTIVRQSKIGGVGFFCPIPAYAEVFNSYGEYDAYYFCLKATMVYIANESDQSKHNVDSKFLIEENRATNPGKAYKDIKAVSPWKAARRMVGFEEGSKRIIGLQAADLMARESFKLIDNRGTKRGIRKPLLRLQDRVRIFGWSRDGLEELRDKYGSDDRSLVRCITDSGGRGKTLLTADNY